MNAQSLVSRNLRHMYIDSFIDGLVGIITPVLVLFCMKTVGLSLSQVLIGEALFAATVLSFEVPSGYLADRWGRKRLMLMAALCYFFTFTTLALAENFTMILIAQVLAGIGMACSSGAKDALLFDSLKLTGRTGEYRRIRSRFNTILFGVAIFSNIAAGFVAVEFGLRAPIYVAAVVLCFGVLNLLFLREAPHSSAEAEYKPIKLRKTLRYVWKNSLVRYMVLFSVVLALGMKLSFHTANPYWELMDVPVVLFGFALACHNLVGTVASLFVERVKHWPDWPVLLGLLGLLSGTFLVMATGVNPGVVFIIVLGSLFQIVRAFWRIVTEEAINQVTYSQHRATVLSVNSFAQQLGQAALLPVFGYAADWWGLFTAFGMLGIFLLLAGGLALWPLREEMQ